MFNKKEATMFVAFILLAFVFMLSSCTTNNDLVYQHFVNATNAETKGDYDSAIVEYTEAIKIEPDNLLAYKDRADAYYKKGDYDHATQDYTFIVNFKTNQPDAAHTALPIKAEASAQLGRIYVSRSDYNSALMSFNQAIQFAGSDIPGYYIERGDIYYAMADYSKAVDDYSWYINHSPSYGDVYYKRGLAYKATGSKSEAIADFKKAVELSTNPDIQQKAKQELKELGAI